MKIVINRCIGSFGLSNEALIRLVERGSPAVYSFRVDGDKFRWQRDTFATPLRDGFYASKTYGGVVKDGVRHILHWTPCRTDPDLIAIVEELGEAATVPGWSGLVVVAIPDGVDWYIEEEEECGDGTGMESIHEVHRVWTE